MLNLSKTAPSAEQLRFIEELASLLTPWGMPQTAARLYGYLLLSDAPVSLEQITADLNISKSGACTAAKLLEQQDILRRYGERGSKRVFYSVSEKPGGPLSKQTALLGSLEALMRGIAPTAPSGPAADRISDLIAFYSAMRQAMETAITALNARPPRAEARGDHT